MFADLASARLEELGGPEPVAGNGQDQVAINTPDSGPPPAAVTIEPYVIPVGKWAEGVTVSNGSLWVAESGSRSVAEVDAASGKIRRHITVGRLPVSMGSAPDGSVYALVETDKAVWVQPPGGGKGRRLATLVDCPQAMAVSDAAVWVLTQPDCSSADSRMVKIDRHGAGEAITESLGEWGQAMTLGHGKAWGAHARGPGISMVDLKTLAFQRVGSGELSFWAITSNSFGIYAGGHQGQDNSAGVIAEINPIDGKEGRRILVPERIAAMTSDDRNVIAVGDKGTIWVVDAGRFAIVKTIKVGGGLGNPRDVILQDGRIVMTDQSRNGDNGALVIIQNWQ